MVILMKLRTKLALAFSVVAVAVVILVGYQANHFLEKQFVAYNMQNQSLKNQDLSRTLSSYYDVKTNKWDIASVEILGMNTLEQGMILKLNDTKGREVWNAISHNNGYCSAMLSNMAKKMNRMRPGFQGGYAEKSLPVVKNGETVGHLIVGYYGPYFYNENDVYFLRTLNRLLMSTVLFAVLLSIGLGIFMADRISVPLRQVTKLAKRISEGDYGARREVTTSTIELRDLAHSVNSLAESLDKQEALRKRLTADVAHELRNPVAGLQSHLETMMDGIWEPSPERLKSCHEEILRIGKLVSGLEDLSKMEVEAMKLNLESFELSALVKGIVLNQQAEFARKKVDLVFNSDEQMVFADREKTARILVNLLSNALKYSDAGSLTEISIGSGLDGSVELTVKDGGCGIPESDLPHIFERFYRVDESRSRATGGTGIGLAIAKALAEAQGGRIEARSELGKGSEFKVILPEKPSV